MKEKILQIFGSIRFWEVTIASFSQIMKMFLPNLAGLWDVITIWLGVVVSIGTADKLAEKIFTK